MAGAALFVTDARQELTAPELEFLRRRSSAARDGVIVVTKIDLQAEWRRIVDLNPATSRGPGWTCRSSRCRRSCGCWRQGTGAERRVRGTDLVTFLASDVVADNQAAAREVEFVASQLEQESQAERRVLAEPERRAEVVADSYQRGATRPTATCFPRHPGPSLTLEHDLQAPY